MATSWEQAAIHNANLPKASLHGVPNEILEKIFEALGEIDEEALKVDIFFTRAPAANPPPFGVGPTRWIRPNPARLEIMSSCRRFWRTLPFHVHAETNRFALASDILLRWPYKHHAELHFVKLGIQRRRVNYSTWDEYDDFTMRIGYTPTALAAAMPNLKSLVIHIEDEFFGTARDATTIAAAERFCNEIIAAHRKLSWVSMTQTGQGEDVTFTLIDQ